MKYKKEKTRNVETRSVRAYYDRSRGSYCLILEDMDTHERVFTLPIYTNEPYRLEDPRVKDAKGNYVKRGVLKRMDGQQGMLFKKFIHHNGHVSIFNYQIREQTNWQADLVLVTDPVTGLSKYRLVNLHILKRG